MSWESENRFIRAIDGPKIVTLRREGKILQRDLAYKAEVSTAAICQYERGARRYAQEDIVERLAAAFTRLLGRPVSTEDLLLPLAEPVGVAS